MKLAAILSLLLVFLSLFSHHSQGQGDLKLCPKKMMLAGKCGSSGGFDCAVEFLGKYGASAMPMHCTCTDVAGQRLCKCDIVCG